MISYSAILIDFGAFLAGGDTLGSAFAGSAFFLKIRCSADHRLKLTRDSRVNVGSGGMWLGAIFILHRLVTATRVPIVK
jgi:hypothetical protein